MAELLNIDFNNEFFTKTLNKMISGLLPYTPSKIDIIKEDIKSYVDKKRMLKELRDELSQENISDERQIEITEEIDTIEQSMVLYNRYKIIEPKVFTDEEVRLLTEAYILNKLHKSDTLFLNIIKYIKPDEFKGEYYVLMKILEQVARVDRNSRLHNIESRSLVTRERFEEIVEYNIENLVRENAKKMGLIEMLDNDGLDTDLSIETNFDTALTYLYNRCMNLYDEIASIGLSVSEAVTYEVDLRTALEKVYAMSCFRTSYIILNGELRIGRDLFSGSKGYFDYIRRANAEYNSRLNSIEENDELRFSNREKMLEEEKQSVRTRVTDWNIPPLDKVFPISTNMLVCLAASEGTGKTQVACGVSAKFLKAGKKALYVATETERPIIQKQILSSYILDQYGIEIPYTKLLDRESLSEDEQLLVNIVEQQFALDDSLIVKSDISYDDFLSSCISYIENDGVGLIVVDHSCALGNPRDLDLKSAVTNLAVACRTLKIRYGITVIVLSHPSSRALEDLARYGEVSGSTSISAESGRLSKEADLNLFLTKVDSNDDQIEGMLDMQVCKIRAEQPKYRHIKIRTKFGYSSYEYNQLDQIDGDETVVSEDDILADIQLPEGL